MKRILITLITLFTLVGCSNALDDKPVGNGQCEQTQRQQFLGITYATERTRFACDDLAVG